MIAMKDTQTHPTLLVRWKRWMSQTLFLGAGLLMFGTHLSCLHSADAEDDSNGAAKQNRFFGILDAGGREFRFSIESRTQADGTVQTELISYDEGEQRFRLDNFKIDDERLDFELKSTSATYSGRSMGGTSYQGKWKQRGGEFELVFRKTSEIAIDKPDEVWTGEISTLFQKLKVRVRLYHQDGGKDRILFDSLSQKAGGFKGTSQLVGEEWVIDVPALKSNFKGKLNADQNVAEGKWTQGGQASNLRLTRSKLEESTDASVPNRPQTPRGPFPYTIVEVVFENAKDKVKLAGTLTIPTSDKAGERFPAVILISGSGPQDRDESLLDHKPFWVIADYLSRNGIAVLRFDDRGTASSTGDFAKATTEDFARDAEAALEFLLGNQRVAPDKIGLLGHSEGGLIAPMLAADRKDVAFIVMLAGPGVNGRDILISQGQLILKAAGIIQESALKKQRLLQEIMTTICQSPEFNTDSDSSIDKAVESAMKQLRTALPDDSELGKETEDAIRLGIKQLSTPWFRFFLSHEPEPILKRVRCSVLALNGEKDVQVDAKLNLPAIRNALKDGGNEDVEVVEMPGINHLFQTCETGGVQEYQTIEETISPAVLQRIKDWIVKSTNR